MALTLNQYREKNPLVANVGDDALADYLHSKYYGSMPFEDFSKAIGYTPKAPEVMEDPNADGDFYRQFKNTFKQLPQTGYGLVAGAGATAESALGEGGYSTGLKNFAVDKLKAGEQGLSETAKDSDSLTYSLDAAKQGDYGALMDWVQGSAGYAAGQGLQLLATGGAGGAAAKIGGNIALKGVVEGMVAKETAKLAAEGSLKNMTTAELTSAATANVANKIGSMGSGAAVGAYSFGSEGGEIGGDLAKQSVARRTPLTGDEIATGLGSTAVAGGLESAGNLIGLDLLKGKSALLKGFESKTGILGKVARGGMAALGAAPIEAGTEYGQTLVEQYGGGHDPFSDESLKQAFDAAGQGAAGGVVMAAGGGAMSSPKPAKTPEQKDQETTRAILNPDASIDDSITAMSESLAWEQPRFKDIPDAEAIVQNRTIPGKGILASINDSFQPSGYVPGEAGQVWEQPNTEQADTQAVKNRAFYEQEQSALQQKADELYAMEMQPDADKAMVKQYRKARADIEVEKQLRAEAFRDGLGYNDIKYQSGQIENKPFAHLGGILSNARPEQPDLSTADNRGATERNNAAPVPTGSGAETTQPTGVTDNAILNEPQQAPGLSDTVDTQAFVPTHELNDGTPVIQAGENTHVDQSGEEGAVDDTRPIEDGRPVGGVDSTDIAGTENNPSYAEQSGNTDNPPNENTLSTPPEKPGNPNEEILTKSKGAYLISKALEFKRTNPKAIDAAKKQNADKVKASYEEDLNRALAEAPFDIYAKHATNQGVTSDGILKQAHEALRQEYGITTNYETTPPQDNHARKATISTQAKGGVDETTAAQENSPSRLDERGTTSGNDAQADLNQDGQDVSAKGDEEKVAPKAEDYTSGGGYQAAKLKWNQENKDDVKEKQQYQIKLNGLNKRVSNAKLISDRLFNRPAGAVPPAIHAEAFKNANNKYLALIAERDAHISEHQLPPTPLPESAPLGIAQATTQPTESIKNPKESGDSSSNGQANNTSDDAVHIEGAGIERVTPEVIDESLDKSSDNTPLKSKKDMREWLVGKIDAGTDELANPSPTKTKGAVADKGEGTKLFSKSEPVELKTTQSVVDESGVHFETSVPVTFNYIHNTESATKIFGKPTKDSPYGRGYEPSGQYITVVGRHPDDRRKGMIYDRVTFNNPLVIENNGLNWKQQLSESFSGKTGKNLSQALINAGYDGVVTTDNGHTSEALNLTNFDKSKAKFSQSTSKISNPHTEQSLLSAIRKVLDGKFYEGWTDAIMATGKFKIIDSDEAAQIGGEDARDAKGFFDPATDTSYFVYDNISQDATGKELYGLISHEIAVHAMQLGKDSDEFKAILKQVKVMSKFGKMKEAAARVPSDTKPEHVTEETLAHFIEANPTHSLSQKVIAAFRKALRAIGKAMPIAQRMKWMKWTNTLSEGDLIAMATDALRTAPTSLQFDNAGRQGDSIRMSYEQSVDDVLDGKGKGALKLGNTPSALVQSGMPNVPLMITEKVIDKAHYDHGLTKKQLKGLPDLLAAPLMVFKSDTQPGSFVVITHEIQGNNPVMVAIKPNGEVENIKPVNIVASAYGKPVGVIAGWVKKGLLISADKKAALAFATTNGLRLPTVIQSIRKSLSINLDDTDKLVNSGNDVIKRSQHGQEKSATDNTGTFNPESNDIRFSRSSENTDSAIVTEAKRKAGLGPKKTIAQAIQSILSRGVDANKQAAKTWWAELQPRLEQGIFDKFYGIKLAEKEILGDVAHSLSGYISARLSTGSSSTMQALLLHGAPNWDDGIIQKKDGSKGFAEILQPVKDDLENFTAWMVGRRADRLYQEGKENNLSRTEIDALLGLKQAHYQSVADDIADMNSSVLDLAQESGLVDPESRELFESNDYIPFYRLIEGKNPGPSKKGGLSHQTSGIKMLKGGDNPMSDPLGNMMQNWAHLIDASMKNDALNKTLTNLEGSHFIESIPSVEFKQALIPRAQIKKLMKEAGLPEEVVDLMPQELTSGIAKMWALQAPSDPDVVKVMRSGKSEYYRVNDAMLLTSLSAVNQLPFGGIFKPMRYMKHLLTAAVTADPTFMARNFIRDSMHSWTIAEEKGFKIGIDSIHGAIKSFNEEGGYIDMMFAGASFQGGYGNYNNPDAARTSMDAALRRKGIRDIQGFKDSILDTPKKYWEMYRSVGDAIENASREAILENAKRAGAEKAQYLFEAKDLMDFSMQGSFTLIRAMSDMLPFFNARLVGLYRLAKAGKTPEARKMILVKGLSIAMFSLALLALNADNDDYEALEDWDKDQYWHFFFGDQHYRIPKPFELGLIFGTVPERSARALLGKDTLGEYAERMGHGASDTLAFNPIPQLFKPFIELYSNKNMFTGRAIEGMADEGKLPSARYNEYTSETMRTLSAALPEALGASRSDWSI